MSTPPELDERALYHLQQRMLLGYSSEAAAEAPPALSLPFTLAWFASAMDALRVQVRRISAVSTQERVVVLTLWQSGPLTIGGLSRLLGMSMPSTSQLVDRLVVRGQVERTSDPADRRRTLVSLMPEALGHLDAVWFEAARTISRRLLEELSPAELDVISKGLAICREGTCVATEALKDLDDDALRSRAKAWAEEIRELTAEPDGS